MNDGKDLDFCLLIPCYNNYEGLVGSLKTVSYPGEKFLIVIVDDGSADPVLQEDIQTEVGKSKPLIILRNERNLGITKSLNLGLSWIVDNVVTKYIARLDCGDLCDPERFILQVDLMDNHPEIGLSGTWCRFVDEETGKGYSYRAPATHKGILREMNFRNVFMHATVMFRADLLKQAGYYPEDFDYAEDYAFFWKLIQLKQSVVIDRYLVLCKVNKKGLSFKNRGKQLAARWSVVKKFSTNPLLRVLANFKLKLLLILPKELTLRLKKLRG